jgi:cytochrome oxidase assembly protein ShyY1
MTPELQNMLAQAQQNAAAAQRQMQFIGYSTYLSIVVCAIFSVLIFWKLCQIQKQLFANSQCEHSKSSSPARPSANEPTSPSSTRSPIPDDSRFMPKK